MEGSEERVVAVIIVGGPTKGTRFRPLSFNVPKPLFPIAGQPMINHPITACRRIPNLVQIFLIGFYEERQFAFYVPSISSELNLPVRYMREDKPLGSAGGLYNFRDEIMEDNPSHIFLLNCDVCCSFPLSDMIANLRRISSFEALQSATIRGLPTDYVRLDQDILSPLDGKKILYTYGTLDFWEQIKTPRMYLKCSALYLSQYRHTVPHLLAGEGGIRSATIAGDVHIHPSAEVHASAKGTLVLELVLGSLVASFWMMWKLRKMQLLYILLLGGSRLSVNGHDYRARETTIPGLELLSLEELYTLRTKLLWSIASFSQIIP